MRSIIGMVKVQRTQSTVMGGVVGLVLSGIYDFYVVALFALAIFFFHISAHVLNDIADIEVDRINEPNRPIARGEITKKQAWVLSLLLFGSGLVFSTLVDFYLFILALTVGLFFMINYNYALKIKDNPFGSPFYLTLAGGVLPYLVGTFVARNINFYSLIFALFIMAISSSVVVMSLKDYEGDKIRGKRTLPVALGLERASKLTSMLIILPVPLYWIPPLLFNFSHLYFLYVLPSLILRLIIGFGVGRVPSKSEAKKHYAASIVTRFWDFLALILAAPPILR